MVPGNMESYDNHSGVFIFDW